MRLLILFASVVVLAQESPSYKSTVRLVNIAFSVRDSRGALVKDLGKEDFEILDDGHPQTISFFARSEDIPLSLGLLADMSGSQEPFAKQHQHDLKEFLKRVVRPQDQAFVLCFGNRLRLASDFSSSAEVLMNRFSHYSASEAREIGPPELRILGTAFYDAIYYATTARLASVERARRALIVFSDGEDNSSARHMMDAIESAQTENVVVFGIRYTEVRHGRMNARNKYGIRVMERISRDTGGMDFDAETTDLKSAFRTIGEELRSSYELAYHAPPADGTFHKLVLRCNRPGMTVRTKTGYFARD